METGTISMTFTGLTPTTAKALWEAYGEAEPTTTAKRGRRSKPEPTVTEEEEELDEFSARDAVKKNKKRAKADEALEEEESEEEEELEEEESEEEEELEEEEDNEDNEEDEVTFSQVKKEIDRYGEKKPKEMKALLAAFDIKSTAELKTKPRKWAPVLMKINATFAKKKRA